MKNKKILLAMSLMMFGLICVPVFSTPFDGIWMHPNPESENAKIIFSDNSFTYEWDSDVVNGQFTYSGNKIEFTASDGSKWSTTYKQNKDVLSLERGKGGWWWYGSFSKNALDEYQNITSDSTPTKFEGTWKNSNRQSENAAISFSGNSFSYTCDTGSKNGRIIFDNKNITLITDDGFKWTTPYSITKTALNLIKGDGCWWYWGSFTKQ
jgi:hypothetical protein